MKTQKTITTITGVLLMAAGLGLILAPRLDAALFYTGIALLFVLASLRLLWIVWKRPNVMSLIELAVCLGLALLLAAHHAVQAVLIQSVFAGYLSILAFFLLVQMVLDGREKAWKALAVDTLLFLIYLIPVVLIVMRIHTDLPVLMRIFGAYLMVLGLQMEMDIALYTRKHPVLSFMLQEWIALPVGFVSFLPGLADWLVRKKVARQGPGAYDAKAPGKPDPNFYVYVHGGLSGEALIGHMTMSDQGVMYSYGDYDRYAEKWFHTMGPGVLFLVNPVIYCNNCCVYENTDIFEFGLYLDPSQKNKLAALLEERYALTYPWKCPLELQPDPAKVFAQYESVYCNRLWYRTGCTFHKFHDSPWKWYFIVGMNCSLYADEILSQIGCHIPHKRGVVSPGEYLGFFETAFLDPSSCVVSRSWHSAAFPETLFDAPD